MSNTYSNAGIEYGWGNKLVLFNDYESAFNNINIAISVFDKNLHYVAVNDAYVKISHRTREDILGRSIFDVFPVPAETKAHQLLRSSFENALATGKPDHIPSIYYPISGPDGELEKTFWSTTNTPVKGRNGETYIVASVVNITGIQPGTLETTTTEDSKQTEMLLRAGIAAAENQAVVTERGYLRSLFDQAPGFMAVLRGPDHVFELANKAYIDIIGKRDIIGRTVAEALPEVIEQGFVDLLDHVYKTGENFIAEGAKVTLNVGPDGAEALLFLDFVYQPIFDFPGDKQPSGIFVQGHDVTELRSTQSRLQDLTAALENRVEVRTAELMQVQEIVRQSQKMEAIGNLAGGIAHDFNNLLQVIQGSIQLVEKRVSDEKARKLLDNALKATAKGAQLASQLLSFGRRQPLEPKVVNPGGLIGEMDELLRRAIGVGVEIDLNVSTDLWNIFVDRTNIETALLNLAINARDAMGGQGKLTIELRNANLDDEYVRKTFDVEPGQYVSLAVTDTGCGIPASLLEKVFDPFFTTKPEGKGTGLGLSMVYGFAKQSGGHVKIYSEVDKGTTVRLYLPRADAPESAVTMASESIQGGSETILVVEDDDAVRTTVAELLRELGYKVLLAADAQSGLEILKSGVAFDLLFTDVVMPGALKSTELAAAVQQRRPDAAILYTSGYTENSIVHGGKLDSGVNFLSKPYTRTQLAGKIRQLLD